MSEYYAMINNGIRSTNTSTTASQIRVLVWCGPSSHHYLWTVAKLVGVDLDITKFNMWS